MSIRIKSLITLSKYRGYGFFLDTDVSEEHTTTVSNINVGRLSNIFTDQRWSWYGGRRWPAPHTNIHIYISRRFIRRVSATQGRNEIKKYPKGNTGLSSVWKVRQREERSVPGIKFCLQE
jgi:hypothetical protein